MTGQERQDGQVFRPIAEVRAQERVAVRGVVRPATAMALRGRPACRYVLADATGELDLMFLGRIAVPGLAPGQRCHAGGAGPPSGTAGSCCGTRATRWKARSAR